MDKLSKELDDITEALDVDQLTDEEKNELMNGATEKFNSIEGVEFEDVSKLTVDEIIMSEFNSSKKVLQKNIDRTEKLTSLIFRNIAVDDTDVVMIGTGVQIINAQNQNLKLLGELQNKAITNLHAQKRLELSDTPKDNKDTPKELPPGFSKA